MERVNEKYGWLIYIFLGVLWLVVGISQTFDPDALLVNEVPHIIGISLSELDALSPDVAHFVRWVWGSLGILKMSWSFFLLAVTLTGYRKGEKWAWYTLWLAPAVLMSQGIFNSVYIGDFNVMLEYVPIMTIALLGLLLPYRKFFPK